jgi:hypothetical protein
MSNHSASLIIDELHNQLIEKIKNYLVVLLENALLIGAYRGAEIFSFGDDGEGEGYLALVKDGEILYFVRHRKIEHVAEGRQILVWRCAEAAHITGGFAQYVFFNLLLPKYKALIADKDQARDGAWSLSNAMQSALSRDLHVYCFDRRSTDKLISLKSIEAINDAAPILWGTGASRLFTFGVVSSIPVTLKSTN